MISLELAPGRRHFSCFGQDQFAVRKGGLPPTPFDKQNEADTTLAPKFAPSRTTERVGKINEKNVTAEMALKSNHGARQETSLSFNAMLKRDREVGSKLDAGEIGSVTSTFNVLQGLGESALVPFTGSSFCGPRKLTVKTALIQ